MEDRLLYLSRADVAGLLDLEDTIEAVASAFRAHAEGTLPAAPGVLGVHLSGGGLHVKTAALGAAPPYVAAKVNANFPDNPARHSLPTIQGLITLFDGERGTPLAVMDAIEITILRTAAASAVAAKALAVPDASVLAICGCGEQGRAHVRAMAAVRPIRRVVAYDVAPGRAERFAVEISTALELEVTTVSSVAEALLGADIAVTGTPSKQPIVTASMLHPGLFLAAVGADNPEKNEIDPVALASTRVVVDLLDQAATMGDLHHAIVAATMSRADIHAELGQVLAGERPGRTSDREVFVFDSTGTALQDVAAARVAYQRAVAGGQGVWLDR